jgi:hypothetical protein
MNRMPKITTIFFMVALLLAACGAPAPATEPSAQPPAQQEVTQPVALDFVVWSYGIETINDSIKSFGAQSEYCSQPWNTHKHYHDPWCLLYRQRPICLIIGCTNGLPHWQTSINAART